MKIWKDKEGNKLTAKEFLVRFKEGIDNITPLQKLENDSRSTFITLIGFIISLVAIIWFRKDMPNPWLVYGFILIFVGSIWSNLVKWLSFRVQIKAFKELDIGALDLNKLLGSMEKVE